MLKNFIQVFKIRKDAVSYKLRIRNPIIPTLIVLLNALGSVFFPLLFRCLNKNYSIYDQPHRILIIRADRIGDMVLATPIFKALNEQYPDAHITCMASSLSGQIIEGNSYIDSIIRYDPPWFDRKKGEKIIRNYMNILRLLRARKFDMAIDLRGNIWNFFFLCSCPPSLDVSALMLLLAPFY